MTALVTGAAGFIGSTLVDRLLAAGWQVRGFDNFSTGQPEFLTGAAESTAFELWRADVLDETALARAVKGCEVVFHLAANADVRFGLEHPRQDFEQNTLATIKVLEAMRAANVPRLVFASTGSVYGEAAAFPTPEDSAFPFQTSLYGASKAAAEGFIEAYSEGFGLQVFIFRFVSILGERYTHGHVFDFYKQLLAHPDYLEVLGDGRQRKSYLYVQDCVDGMLLALERASGRVNIFNLGTDEYCHVTDSITWITAHVGLQPPRLHFTGGDRGWTGDNPFIFLDCRRMRSLGWSPKLSIRESVVRTVAYLQANTWILDRR